MNAFNDLMAFQKDTEALAQVAGRLGWDQETVMPAAAAPQRGDEMAAMEKVLHARRIDPKIADWLNAMTQTRWTQLARRSCVKFVDHTNAHQKSLRILQLRLRV